MTPLLPGPFARLDDLFEDFRFVPAVRTPRGNSIYHHERGWYFLSGLPGSIRLSSNEALYVKPLLPVIEASQPHMTNAVIGAFRAVRSAHWMKQGLLPVFVADSHMIASPLLAFVPYSEHERFNR